MSRLSAALTKIATLVMAHKEIIGSDTMTTTAQTLTGAVNELDGDITSLNGKTTLSTSYISNPHVSSTSFGRVYAYKKGNTLFLNGNLEATWASGFSAFVPIGTINGWSAITDVFGMACSQTDPAYGVTFKISASGEISLFASKQWAGTPFMRFFVCVPCL